MSNSLHTPPQVRHSPVSPLRPAVTAVLGVAITSVLSVAVMRIFLAFRDDLLVLGVLEAFGLSIVELAAAALLLAVAVRQLIPGRLMPSKLLAGAIAVACLCTILVGTRTAIVGPRSPAEGEALEIALLCVAAITLLAWPYPFLFRPLFAANATPRTKAAAVMAGLGAGIATNAVWRLFCPYTDASHQILGHGGGIALVVAIATALLALSGKRLH